MAAPDAPDRSTTHRRIPIITVVCLAATLGLLLLMAFVPLPDPGGLLIYAPPALGLLGGAAALLDRQLEHEDKRDWAIGSALAGFVGVIAFLIIASWIEATGWTINGPPPWL
ncbi:hypothetical protein IFT51_14750 [Frigoribacterium sp. CFBP 13712]|nr:hypothetical protein [Frigoribacterium sp. CFBP 13712]